MEWMLNLADVQQRIRYVFIPKPPQQRKIEMSNFNLHAAAVGVSGANRADHGDEQGFLTDVVMKISALSDADWNGMHADLQSWYNNACDAMTAEKPIAGLGPADAAPARRRPAPPAGGASTTTADAPAGGESSINTDAITVGMSVRLKTARMDVSGDVTEVGKNVVKVKQADGTEKAVAIRRIKEAFSVGGGAPAAPAAPAAALPSAPTAGGPLSLDQLGEGMHVVVRTARKEVSGVVVSIGKTALVIKEDGTDKEQRVAMRRITEVEAVGGGDAPAAVDAAVDAGTLHAVRQAIVDDLEAAPEDIHSALVEEDGVEVSPHVVAAVHADTHAIIGLLSQAGLMGEDE